jgi:hypothetical protein
MTITRKSSSLTAPLLLVGALVSGLSGCAGGPGPTGHGSRTLPPVAESDIKGHPPTEVRYRLGAPSLTRREPPAEVWQYSSSACVIDVVFYPTPGGSLSAEWLDSRTLDGSPIDKNACLKTIGRD